MPPNKKSCAKGHQAEPEQSWKTKLNDKQLERKRQADRISQRRTREQSKQAAALFKDKMNLLLEGDQKTVLEQMVVDNEALRAKLNTMRTKFEHVYRISKECLEMDEDKGKANIPGFPHSSSKKSTPSKPKVTENSQTAKIQAEELSESDNIMKKFSRQPSIFLPIVKAMKQGMDGERMDMSAHRFIEAMLAWKYSQGLTDGLEYLTQYYNVHAFAQEDVLYSKITTSEFYFSLLELLHDLPGTVSLDQSVILGAQELNPLSQSNNSTLSYLDLTRRKTAYLAYQLVSPWRDSCRSQAELIALFWAQYRHLLLFVFPSIENLAKCPVWYRPEPSRLLQNYPGYIDFIIWPRIRQQLTRSWHEHDTENLIRALIRGFSLCNMDIKIQGPLIYTKNDTELHLSQPFERALAKISNFHAQPQFLADHPDLAVYDHTDWYISDYATLQTGGKPTPFTSQAPSPSFRANPIGGQCTLHDLSDHHPLLSFPDSYQTHYFSRDSGMPGSGLSSHLGMETVADDATDSHVPMHSVDGLFDSASVPFEDASFLNSTVNENLLATWHLPEYEIDQAAASLPLADAMGPTHHTSHLF